MTENRYLTNLLTGDIIDTVTNEFIKGSNIARRLNELQEENEQSKMMIATLRNIVLENENLKKENKELKQSISDWQGSYDELYEDNLKLEKEIKELKERNNRQYNQLGKLYELIEKQDGASLTTIIEDLKQAEEQLQKEWGTYGDLND